MSLRPLLGSDPRRVGPYRLLARVGAGGMGNVFAARSGESLVAVKVIHTDHASDPDFRTRFARETAMIRRVRSPYLPFFYDADPDAPRPWLATEYIPGLTLREHLRQHGPFNSDMLRTFGAAVAEALFTIHASGIVHRDLKPGNVILSADGPRVLDFGIARAVDERALTRTGALVGTPGWISPEQYAGHSATPASDLFAWGALMALAATGRAPYGHGTADVMAYRVTHHPPDLTDVPDALRELVTATMELRPEMRPTATEVLSAIHATGHPGPERTADLVARTWRVDVPTVSLPRRAPVRRPLVLSAGVLALLVLVAVLPLWSITQDDGLSLTALDRDQARGGTVAEQSGDDERTAIDVGDDGPEVVSPPLPEAARSAVSSDQWESSVEVGELSASEAAELASVDVGTHQAVFRFRNAEGDELRVNVYELARPADSVFVLGTVMEWPDDTESIPSEMFVLYDTETGASIAAEEQTINRGSVDPDQAIGVNLTFRNAPENGLLIMEGTQSQERLSTALAVGVCYQAKLWGSAKPGPGDGFSLDYSECSQH